MFVKVKLLNIPFTHYFHSLPTHHVFLALPSYHLNVMNLLIATVLV